MKREESILVYCLPFPKYCFLRPIISLGFVLPNQFPTSFTCQSPNAKLLHNSLRIKLKSKVAFQQALKRLPLHSLNCLKIGLKPCFVYLKISSALQMREEGNSSGSAMDTTTTTVASSTTPDEATYIAQHLGAQHLPLTTIIPISVCSNMRNQLFKAWFNCNEVFFFFFFRS